MEHNDVRTGRRSFVLGLGAAVAGASALEGQPATGRTAAPALKAALAAAARTHEPGVPLDWMDTTTPERWQLDGKPVRYNWYEED